MKIGVNFSYKLIASRGIARYIENLLANLHTSDDEYYFFIPKNTTLNYDFSITKHIVEIDTHNYFIFEHIKIPKEIRKYQIDVLINPANTVPMIKNTKWLSVIHDVIPFKLNTTLFSKKWLINVYMRYVMKKSITKSDRLLTVSMYSKHDIESLKFKHKKISVIYNGFNHKKNINMINNEKNETHFPKEHIFWLGGDGYNKNMKLVQEILLRGKINKTICIVGLKKEENIQLMRKLGANVYIDVSDYELEMLYTNAKVFIFPSLYEGFGIPILEALNYKVPYIVSSNTTSLPEVCGNACYLVNPNSVEDFETLINNIYENKIVSKCSLYSEQLSKFRWDNEAKKLYDILMELNK